MDRSLGAPLVLHPDEVDDDLFPHLQTISAAFMFRFLPHPTAPPRPPEYVFVPLPDVRLRARTARLMLGIHEWNWTWQSGVWRQTVFDRRRLPRPLHWLLRYPDTDFRLVPLNARIRRAYEPLYHLLPADTLARFGLPLVARGGWPPSPFAFSDVPLPQDLEDRLAAALAYHLWPLLAPGQMPSAFSRTEPIRLLSHSLDYWLPYLDLVAQERVRALGTVDFDDDEQRALLERVARDAPDGMRISRPLYGGTVWQGKQEAWEVTQRLVEVADEQGRLRAILDAVRAHRVADDFSARWSYAREDFERKLYRKRNKVRVSFIELHDTVPAHGPFSEAEENLLWQDFLSLVDVRDRRVVVCLRSGATRATDIARELGYANHSPVSKALARIRRKAERFLGNGD